MAGRWYQRGLGVCTRAGASCRDPRGQTIVEFVLIAGMLVLIAIALNSILPPSVRQFAGRVTTSIAGVGP